MKSVSVGLVRHGKCKTYFLLSLLGLVLIKLTYLPNTAIDLVAVTSRYNNISCDNNLTITATTTIQNTFQNDPNPNEPWPRIAWLMTYPNSVRTK